MTVQVAFSLRDAVAARLAERAAEAGCSRQAIVQALIMEGATPPEAERAPQDAAGSRDAAAPRTAAQFSRERAAQRGSETRG